MSMLVQEVRDTIACDCGRTLGIVQDGKLNITRRGLGVLVYPGSEVDITCPQCGRKKKLRVRGG